MSVTPIRPAERAAAAAARHVRTVVLDDDPTGTQSASDVRVLLHSDRDRIKEALRRAPSVYVQTNSRAVDVAAATDIAARVKDDAFEAARQLGVDVEFVLRGDSTLRGHVFAETAVFAGEHTPILFVPAFPDGGRTTVRGRHYVRVHGEDVPAHETEYARDPVFGFTTSTLSDYVAQRSERPTWPVGLEVVRAGSERCADEIAKAPHGAVILPDAATNRDIAVLAQAVDILRKAGTSIVVRCAAPLAARLAAAESDGILPRPIVEEGVDTLLICGSHTEGATRQLDRVAQQWTPPITIDTDQALSDPYRAAGSASDAARGQLRARGLAVVASERTRSAEHNTLEHGARVMEALTLVARRLRPDVRVVIAKGGVTSAEVARTGFDARSATVRGQVLPGIPVWELDIPDYDPILYIVVPGNIGEPETLLDVLAAVGLKGQ